MGQFDCETVQPLLLAWQEGALSPWMSWRVKRHVQTCPACAQELTALSGLDSLLRQATPFGPEVRPLAPRSALSPALIGWSSAAVVLLLTISVGLLYRPTVSNTVATQVAETMPTPVVSATPLSTPPSARRERIAITQKQTNKRIQKPSIVRRRVLVAKRTPQPVRARYALRTVSRPSSHKHEPIASALITQKPIPSFPAKTEEVIMVAVAYPPDMELPDPPAEPNESLYIEAHPVANDVSTAAYYERTQQ